MTSFHTPRRARGISLVEMLFAFATILLLVALIFTQYRQRQNDLLFTRLLNDHRSLVASVHAIGAGRADYFIAGNNWNGALASANAVPASMNSTAAPNVFVHTFGGLLTLTPLEFQGPSSGGTFPGFPMIQLTYANLPRAACFRFAATLAPSSYDLLVNGTRATLGPQPDLIVTDLNQLTALCNSNANTVQITSVKNIPFNELSSYTNLSAFGNILSTKYAALLAQRRSFHP
jgi:PilS N terminal